LHYCGNDGPSLPNQVGYFAGRYDGILPQSATDNDEQPAGDFTSRLLLVLDCGHTRWAMIA
jgi:hypothetical protein